MPDLDIGIVQIVDTIVEGTTNYLATFSPVIYLTGGIVLAFGIMAWLISIFTGKRVDAFEEDDTL